MTTATPKAAGVPATFGWRLPWVLGLGAFGLAFSITTTAAYLPPLLGRFTDSRTMIAAVLAAEGVFALTLPVVIGPWSDTFHTPLGRRRPFMLVALGPMGFCLALMAFMPSLWTTTLIVLAFFFAYYVYEPPYRGLYPDVLPPSAYGRAQGVQHVLRGLALGLALVGGGLLFHVWHAAPFLIAAFVTTIACGATIVFVMEDGGHGRVFEGVRAYVAHSYRIARGDTDVRRWLVANAAWEGAFAAERTFVVLYITRGLHQPLSTSSAVLGTVAAGYMIAAVFSGPLGDRVGLARVIFVASFVYGGGLLLAGFATSWQQLVLRARLSRRDRGRRGDDARLGPALHPDAGRAARRDLRARDLDEGLRAPRRAADRGRADRRALALPARDGRVPGPLADLRGADPGRDPADLDADARRG